MTGVKNVRVRAPAKVNFGLRVVGRRADGYHEIESLFVPLDLADEVCVAAESAQRATVRLRLQATPAGVPDDAANLAVRAAEAFLAAAGSPLDVCIDLEKRVPVAAGLGGGSSDAGAVLRALSDILPGAVGPRALARLALDLGADVPFFLDPQPAWVRGVGERIDPAPGLPRLALLLVNPGAAVSTAEVYRAFDVLHPAPRSDALARELPDLANLSDDLAGLARLLSNDLEAPALRLCPAIARLRARLAAHGALAVGMSGSGATLFGVFESLGAAREALATARFEPPVWAQVATTLESR
jgi:4-diphosphocytidyl-2-C-methyl-D-erythritol kinase